jgi:exodeoxyribonuclease VIII
MFDKRTKKGKEEYEEFLKTIGNKTPIPADMYALGINMNNAIKKHPLASKLIKGEPEVPLFWKDDLTGEECKCRLDVLRKAKNRLVVVDLKTTEDASTESFIKSMVNYGYDFQAAMYSEGVKANYGEDPLFVFIAIEKKEPYAINILQADDLVKRRGYDLFREYIGIYHECKQTNNWYGYLGESQIINSLSLPAWLAKEFE